MFSRVSLSRGVWTAVAEEREYEIREVEVTDAVKILNLVLTMADESDNFPFTSEDFGMSPENQRSFILYMQNMKNSVYYGAFIAEEPIGLIYLEGGRRNKTFHLCSLGMGVSKAYWGRGIGKALLKKALNFACDSEYIAKIDLQVRTDNTSAIHLYRSFGFETEGRSRRAIFSGGEFYDYLSMGKIID